MASSINTFIASIEIIVNDLTINRVNTLRINQRFDSHHDFEIYISPEMLGNRSIKLKDVMDKCVGWPVTIIVKQQREGFGEQFIGFKGIVTSVTLSKGQGQANSYVIGGYSPTIAISQGSNTRTFSEKTLKDIVKSVITPMVAMQESDSNLIDPSYLEPIDYVTQYEESDYHLLQRLAEKYGEWMFYDGVGLVFGKNGRENGDPVDLIQNMNLFDMSFNLQMYPLNERAWCFDYESFKGYDVETAEFTVPALQSYSQTVYDMSEALFVPSLEIGQTAHRSQPSLRAVEKERKNKRTNKLAVLSGRTSEMPLMIGYPIKVRENVFENGFYKETIDYGNFTVTKINHFVDTRGIYQAYFEAIPVDGHFPPAEYPVTPRKAPVQLASIKETDDPKKLGRVRAKFTWQMGEEITPWIPVSNMMTGLSQAYFIPEKGDLVMIDFEMGNPDAPFVVGGIYTGDGGPREPKLVASDNTKKGIVTKSGNSIIIDDTDGHETIKIFNKENKNSIELSLDGSSHINIKSKGSVNISAGSINLNASDITIKASKNLLSYGEESAFLGSDKEVAIGAKKIDIGADQEINIGADLVAVNAKSLASVKSDIQVDVAGQTMVGINGGIVMIN